jgi:broad specificity phosphatase PhoE
MDTLEVRLRQAERVLDVRIGKAKQVFADRLRAEQQVADLLHREEILEQAIAVLNSYADQQQVELHRKIEGLVTHGLRTIFTDQDMVFRLKDDKKGKLATTDFVVVSGDLETSVLAARGGGVAAVVGFILRVVLLLLRPEARHVLVLDESFAQLSAEYEPALAEFIRELCDRTDMQVVLVTHSTAYGDAADREYRFALDAKGVTQVEVVGE